MDEHLAAAAYELFRDVNPVAIPDDPLDTELGKAAKSLLLWHREQLEAIVRDPKQAAPRQIAASIIVAAFSGRDADMVCNAYLRRTTGRDYAWWRGWVEEKKLSSYA